ncbi:hypothetical protein [Sneathiella chinensis]|uniref:Zinc finger MYND domain-containing protein n=1 Tax=Sneathiella chinensis TaxID=349750 RepID=A0ABQ5U182_9PROT|nr:hypothetical protein [Sneathiella chinensis]GLQ05872.1 hypothetical protein GCM10007924_10930 [Sneathiella chinensis]
MIEFRWRLDQGGYQVVVRKGELGLFSGQEPYSGEVRWLMQVGGPEKEYQPLGNGIAVHRKLAELNENDSGENDVLSFCNEFGLLSHDWPDSKHPGEMFPFGLKIDPKLGVQPNRQAMRLDKFWYLQEPVRVAVKCLDEGDKFGAASVFNHQAVTQQAWLQYHRLSGKFEKQFIPVDLISAVWMQVEQEISGQRNWKRCQNCQTWFLPQTKRAVYCRKACKVAWHRKQKKGEV